MPPDHPRNAPPLPPALDAFCTRFAAGAGTLYQWEVRGGATTRALRAHLGRGRCACPLSAQSTCEYGRLREAWDVTYAQALREFGLAQDECRVLLNAADGLDLGELLAPALRTRLLHICGLREEE